MINKERYRHLYNIETNKRCVFDIVENRALTPSEIIELELEYQNHLGQINNITKQ